MREAINDIFDNGMTSFIAENRATGLAIGLGLAAVLGGFGIGMIALPLGMALSSAAVLNIGSAAGLTISILGAVTAAGAVAAHDAVALGNALLSPFRDKEQRFVINKAGQDVRGPSWAIAALEKTQAKIDKITARFNNKALPRWAENRIEGLEDNSRGAIQAVRVSTGAPGYQFAR